MKPCGWEVCYKENDLEATDDLLFYVFTRELNWRQDLRSCTVVQNGKLLNTVRAVNLEFLPGFWVYLL